MNQMNPAFALQPSGGSPHACCNSSVIVYCANSDVSRSVLQSGLTCLHMACLRSSQEVVEVLTETGGKELVLKLGEQDVSILNACLCLLIRDLQSVIYDGSLFE